MHKYKPAKRAAASIYILLTVVLVVVTGAIFLLIPLIGEYDIYIVAAYWILHAFFACVMIPMYFRHSMIGISHDEIVRHRGILTLTSEFMPMESVKSVTTVITPLSRYTGVNFIIINALGSKIMLAFMKKDDCLEATEYINDIIRSRKA